MKIKGIIIDAAIKKDVLKIYPSIIWNNDTNEIAWEGFDDFNSAILKREKAIDDITNRYMSGQDDSKWFWFSDCEEGVNAIKSVFPDFEIIEVERDDYPMDYDYLRDDVELGE